MTDEILRSDKASKFQLALIALRDWLDGTESQRARLKRDRLGRRTSADAALFTFALRNVRRAAELAADFAPTPQVQRAIRHAVEEFDNSLPSLVDLRDVLEHFDDYVKMVGKLQHPESLPKNKRSSATLIDRWKGKRHRRTPPGSFGFWAVRLEKGMRVGAGELELEVDQAIGATRQLAAAVLAPSPP